MTTRAELIELAKELAEKNEIWRSFAALNTPTDHAARVDLGARYTVAQEEAVIAYKRYQEAAREYQQSVLLQEPGDLVQTKEGKAHK